MSNDERKTVGLTESSDCDDIAYTTAMRQLADALRLRESHLMVLPLRPEILRTLVYLPPGWALHMIGRARPGDPDGVMHIPHAGPMMVTRLYPMMIEMTRQGAQDLGDPNAYIPFGILTIPDSMDISRWCALVGFENGPLCALGPQIVVPAVDGPTAGGAHVPALAIDALAAAWPDEVADIWGSVTTEQP